MIKIEINIVAGDDTFAVSTVRDFPSQRNAAGQEVLSRARLDHAWEKMRADADRWVTDRTGL